MTVCFVCGQGCLSWWTLNRQQEDGWYFYNPRSGAAPSLASPDPTLPVHYRCRPVPNIGSVPMPLSPLISDL